MGLGSLLSQVSLDPSTLLGLTMMPQLKLPQQIYAALHSIAVLTATAGRGVEP